ncbi:MAG: hypothetical protein IJN57_06995 [Oscillospiraceae bacterium]|nr:hypothetical protein [Oscillospiraceae bacterium]
MTITPKFGLQLPSADEYYDIGQYNENLHKLDTGAVCGIGIGTIRVMTPEEYAALTEPDSTVLYIVTDGSTAGLYLGTAALSGSASTLPHPAAASAASPDPSPVPVQGTATKEEIT